VWSFAVAGNVVLLRPQTSPITGSILTADVGYGAEEELLELIYETELHGIRRVPEPDVVDRWRHR
jgi:hypothetical protein